MRSLPYSAQLYLFIVYLGGLLAVADAEITPRAAHAEAWELVLFLCLALLAGGKRISLSLRKDMPDISISIGFVVTFAAMLRFGPAGAILAGAAGSLAACVHPKCQQIHQLLFNVSLSAIEGLLAGIVFFTVNGDTLQLQALPTFIAVAASSMTFFLINSAGIALIISLSARTKFFSVWKENFAWIAPSYVAAACISTLAMILGGRSTGVTLLFITPVAYFLYQSYSTYTARAEEKQKHIEALQKSQVTLRELYIATIKSLALAIDAKDQYTHQHILRVQRYAMATANHLGLTGTELEGLNTGALLHDIGKLGIPEHVLLKPGRLTSDEYDKIKQHPEIGAAILDPVDFPWPVLPVVKYHHEKWDGTGYPCRLKGEDIPLTARILSVADVYDALTSARPYRKAWTHEDAVALIQKDSGTHFDPVIAQAFLAVIDNVLIEMDREPGEWHVLHKTAAPEISRKANQAATAIYRASNELWALYEVAQTLSSSLGLRDTLDILARKLELILPNATCLFLLHDDDGDAMSVRAVVGPNRAYFECSRPISVHSRSRQVSLTKQTYAGEYDPDDLMLAGKSDAEWTPLHSAVIVPLVHKDAVYGTINVYFSDTDKKTAYDARLLETIAERAAMAINNARLFDRACSEAMTDPLTGLSNLRHLTAAVEEMCHGVQSSFTGDTTDRRSRPEPFALLCLDLDSFKPINDNFGHHKGDQVLQDLARLFRSHVREKDIVARYGGDEFLIALHEAGPAEASAMARRIQDAVYQYNPGLVHDQLGTLRLGVSIGWACFPNDGIDCASLLSAADSLMYHDKTTRKLGRLVEQTSATGKDAKLYLAA